MTGLFFFNKKLDTPDEPDKINLDSENVGVAE